jgi:signal peptidase I
MRPKPPRRRPASKDQPETVGSLARFFVVLILFTWALRSLIVQPFNIPSGSMLPALYIGDYLVVAKWPYGYSRYSFPFDFPPFDGRVMGHLPQRGDVVVFHHPVENSDLIKRVIGLPGDTIAVRGGQIVLNGRAVPRQRISPVAIGITANSPCKVVPPAQPMVVNANGQALCRYNAFREMLPGGPSYIVLDQVEDGPSDDFGPIRVPAGHIFLMGDNRDDSLDSRFSPMIGGVGMLPTDHLIGRAMVTFWSTDGSASYLKPWTWFHALRADRIGNGYTEGSE